MRSLSLFALLLVALSPLVAHADTPLRNHHAHDRVARRKRSDSPTCKPRPSTSPAAPSTTDVAPAYTPSSSLPSSTTSATPPASTSGTKKWGLCWGADPKYIANFDLPKVQYVYNWSPSIPSELTQSGLVGMPMFWGTRDIGTFQTAVTAGSSQFILGMNEPNEPSQSYMDAGEGASLWMQYINPLAGSAKLISPACTNDDAGLDWYDKFFKACTGCHFDGIAFHAYTIDAQAVVDYATKLHNTYNLPIYITEFADQDFSPNKTVATMDQVWDFAGVIRDFVDNTPWIAGAFPFAVTDLSDPTININTFNSLINPDGTPTALAHFYYGG